MSTLIEKPENIHESKKKFIRVEFLKPVSAYNKLHKYIKTIACTHIPFFFNSGCICMSKPMYKFSIFSFSPSIILHCGPYEHIPT